MSGSQSRASGDDQAKELERRLEAIAEQYLNQLQAGEAPDRKALIDGHPDIAEQLERRLTLLEILFRAAQECPLGATALEEPHSGRDDSLGVSTQRNGSSADGRSRDRSASSVGHHVRSGNADEPGGTSTVAYYPVTPEIRPGRYVLTRFHKRGGMGEIWLANDTEIGRQVAIKRLLKKRQSDLDRFFAEAQITGQLQHQSIVPVHDLGVEADRQPFYVMKFVQGRTLRDAIDEYHAAENADGAEREVQRLRLLEVFIDLCQAVAFAHSQGVLHRDLKPENVMLGPYGETQLLDWGLAKVMQQPDILGVARTSEVQLTRSGTSSETQYGSVLGTPSHMSPELAEGRPDEVDERTDVYLLGATLYHILTGEPPRSGRTRAEMIELARSVDPPSPRQVNRDTPRPLNAICQKAMSRRRQSRYATSMELADDVQRYLAGEAVSVLPEGPLKRAWRWSKRHRTALLRGVAAALLVGMVILTLIKLNEARSLRLSEQARSDAEKIHAMLDRVQFDLFSRGSSFEHVGIDARHSKNAVEQVGDIARRWGPGFERIPLDGRRPVMCRELFELYRLLGEPQLAADAAKHLPPRSNAQAVLDHFLKAEEARLDAEGPTLVDDDKNRERLLKAVEQYLAALSKDPQHYWSHFQLGRCYTRLSEASKASKSFATFVALRPDASWARSLALL